MKKAEREEQKKKSQLFYKGMKRLPNAGRRKGTPNKKVLWKVNDIALQFQDKDINPIKFLFLVMAGAEFKVGRYANGEDQLKRPSIDNRVDAATELVKYIYPKAQQAPHSDMTNDELIAEMKSVIRGEI